VSETVRRMKANKRVAGKKCGWCREELAFGEEAAICEECRALHHAGCWDEKAGCARSTCVNAPLQQVAPPPAAAPGPVGVRGAPRRGGGRACPHCGAHLPARAPVCRSCGLAPTPDGVYRGPKRNAPGAVASLVCGLVGLLICGVILGIIAIVNANKARSEIRRNPHLGGGGMATAGLVLGIIDIPLGILFAMINIAARS
jgi:hypothetical protein